MQQKVYYLTSDEANGLRAEKLGAAQGLEVEVIEPGELAWLDRAGAVVLDWDGLPAEERSGLVEGQTVRVVGVHGYHLSDALASFLPLRGIVVSRHLDGVFIEALAGRAA